jgi:hypothetical protein
MAFGLGYRISLVYQLVWAVLFAGAIEFAQYWVPGRHARISDLVVDVEAACVGVLCARIFSGWLIIWFNRRTRSTSSDGVRHRGPTIEWLIPLLLSPVWAQSTIRQTDTPSRTIGRLQ